MTDASDFIESFDRVAASPLGVAAFRQLALDLAVGGNLVEQDPDDSSADWLLEATRAEKAELVATKRIPRPRPLPSVDAGEGQPHLPASWRWAYLADALSWDLTDGDWVESKDQDPSGEVRLVQLADVGVGEFKDKSSRFLTAETAARLNCTYLEEGVVLIARLPRPLARACVFPGVGQPCVTVVDVAIARSGAAGLRPDYLVAVMNSSAVREQTEQMATGTTRKRVSTGNLRKLRIPVPPLEEQARITARVLELYELCDEFEVQRRNWLQSRTVARRSALDVLKAAQSPEELRCGWERVQVAWTDFTDDVTTVEQLRQLILHLAFRGQLVPQDPEDKPAALILESVAASPVAPPAKFAEEHGASELPSSWTWTDFGSVTDSRLGKMLDKAKNTGPPRPYLRNANVQWFKFALDDVLELRLEDEALDECSVKAGDLLVVEGGEPGRAAICDETVAGMVFQKALHRVRPIDGVRVGYLALLLRHYTWEGSLETLFTGATITHLTGRALRACPIPLPPPREQDRIVKRIDEMLALCEALENGLKARDAVSTAFAASWTRALASPPERSMAQVAD